MIDRNPREEQPLPLPTVITHETGLQFKAQVGAHELILDQPLRGGGEDAGPSPIELLGAALGSCVALYVHKFLLVRGHDDPGLQVEVRQYSARAPHRIARFEVRILVPGLIPLMYAPMIEAVARVCPVHNTLAAGAEIAVSVKFAETQIPESPFATSGTIE
jgi:putative redox protein